MESLGSHGVVIVLLLVVVAAALITGRNRKDPDVESSLAEHSDLLEFDLGEKVELPIPDHGASGFAQGKTTATDASTSHHDPVDAAPYDMMIEQAPKNYAEPSDQAVVSLDAPSTVSASPDAAIGDTAMGDMVTGESNAVAEFGTSPIQRNQFVAANDRVDATSVSSRKPSSTVPSLPSLEELSENPSDNAATPKHRLSRTPALITNLLQYLPPRPQAAVESESQTPTSTNETVDPAVPTYSE